MNRYKNHPKKYTSPNQTKLSKASREKVVDTKKIK